MWIVLSAIVLIVIACAALKIVSLNVNQSVTGYVGLSSAQTITDNEGVTANPNILAAQPAVLTTHTTNTTGSLTMNNSNHGIITGQRFDVYWAAGQCYGAIAGTVNNTVVPIASVVGGTALPISNTNVTIGVCAATAFVVTGSNLAALVIISPQNGYAVFNASGTDEFAQYLVAGVNYIWTNAAGGTSPLATFAITQVNMSHSYTGGTVTGMTAAALTH